MAETDPAVTQNGDLVASRIGSLEEKVNAQGEEIFNLKLSLADALKRIGNLEAAGSSGSHQALPSRPSLRPSLAPPPKSAGQPAISASTTAATKRPSSVSASVSAARKDVGASLNASRPQAPSSASTFRKPSARKWQSSEHVAAAATATKENAVHVTVSEGTARMYLRGRPIVFQLPTGHQQPEPAPSAPATQLKLQWVYGYRGRDCRSNLYTLPSGELVYFVAAVAVLYDVEKGTQRHYVGHTDDVKCLAIHPDKKTIATGQVAGHDSKWSAGKPHVRIWDSATLATLKVIGVGVFERAVSCLAFSVQNGGLHLVAVDEGNDHNLTLWDWQKGDKGTKLAEAKSSGEAVLNVEFHPIEKDRLVLTGKNMIANYEYIGGALKKQLGIFEKFEKPKFVTSLAFSANGDTVTGDSNGTIFIWGKGEHRITDSILNAHDGGIFALSSMPDGSLVSGGGKDRLVKRWALSTKTVTEQQEVDASFGAVRTVSTYIGDRIVVGTTQNAILEGSLKEGFKLVIRGHFDELWGLTVHPSEGHFLTCGTDKQVFLWDAKTHSSVWTKDIKEAAQCATFHPKCSVVAIGTTRSRWLVLDTTTAEILSTQSDGEEQIECIEYSPDGAYVAVGSRDNNIYVYESSDDGRKYTRLGKCHGHTSFVTHIDWSADSKMLVSNSGDYEVLYWSLPSCKQVTHADKYKDLQFATQNCTLALNSMGIWQEGADGTDVNACSRSSKADLLATGDDFGSVNLYSYPSRTSKAPFNAFTGHSSHVTNVRFLPDDSYLLSTGGKDTSVLQWSVVRA